MYGLERYLQYSDLIDNGTSKADCESKIRNIIISYSYETIIEALAYVAKTVGPSNALSDILNTQKLLFRFHYKQERVVVHREATNVLFQFVFSMRPIIYGIRTEVNWRDIYILYLLVNDFINFCFDHNAERSGDLVMFFNSSKSVRYLEDRVDIRAKAFLFSEYYKKINLLNDSIYNDLVVQNLGCSFDEFFGALADLRQNSKFLYSLYDKFAVIDVSDIYGSWSRQNLTLAIPDAFLFLEKYPLIKIKDKYLVTDASNLINLSYSYLYSLFYEHRKNDFKSLFGKMVVEPVVIELIENVFVNYQIKKINVEKKGFEYADAGILFNDIIILFEIKSTYLRRDLLFANLQSFEKHFNDRLVKKEGVSQQFGKLKIIEESYETFCRVANIPLRKYKILPVLLFYDEIVGSFYASRYMSSCFNDMIKYENANFTNFVMMNSIVMTFTELYRLLKSNKAKNDKFMMLTSYSKSRSQYPLNMFLNRKKYL